MSSARIPIVVALALMVSSVGALGIVTGDDAGSGSDAPDERDRALGLAPGTYEANITPAPGALKDADWYAAETEPTTAAHHSDSTSGSGSTTTSYTCTRVNATSARPIELIVDQPAVDGAELQTAVGGVDNESLGLVGPTTSDALAGFLAPTRGAIATYSFELERTPISQIVSASPDPAPSTPAPINTPCFGDTIEDGDPRDAWNFTADADERVLLTFVSDGNRTDRLTLVGPDGEVEEEITSAGSIAVTEVDLASSGTWTIDVESTSSTLDTRQTYMIGFSLADDPEEEEEEKSPCRPHCMASLR